MATLLRGSACRTGSCSRNQAITAPPKPIAEATYMGTSGPKNASAPAITGPSTEPMPLAAPMMASPLPRFCTSVTSTM